MTTLKEIIADVLVKDAKVTTLKEIIANVMVKEWPTHIGHSILGSHGKRNQMGGECQMPCQREPFWIPFAPVMELGNIPNILRDTIRSKARNMIDIGKCIWFCRPSQFSLSLNVPVSKPEFVKIREFTLVFIFMFCPPWKFWNFTEFSLDYINTYLTIYV